MEFDTVINIDTGLDKTKLKIDAVGAIGAIGAIGVTGSIDTIYVKNNTIESNITHTNNDINNIKEKKRKEDKEEKESERDKEGEEGEEETEQNEEDNPELNKLKSKLPIPIYSYEKIEQMVQTAYNPMNTNNSTICDIIAMYLKGQKILYTEAKTICEQRLNYLMLPTIGITAICTVLSVVLKEYPFSSTIVSTLNGINFCLLALISYLKLDAKAEAHRVAAYKFDKIQSKLEFNSGRILFLKSTSKELPTLINDTEKDVREIKETNQFILPENIRYNYPKLNNINVFAEVKKIQCTEMLLVNKLKDVYNERATLYLKIHSTNKIDQLDSLKLEELDTLKKSIIDGIIKLKDQYLDIDNQFEEEVAKHRERMGKGWQLCSCLKS
jgi:hypothetical protein